MILDPHEQSSQRTAVASVAASAGGSIRVSLFYDEVDWAFHNIALNLDRISCAPYVFRLVARDEWFANRRKTEQILATSDLAVFMWRFDLLAFLDSLGESGWRKLSAGPRCALVALVYDHVYTDESALTMHGNPLVVADSVAASSRRLCQYYSAAAHLPDITHCLPDGVDLARFSPPDPDTASLERPLRIGWVGNSAWGETLGQDFKGKRTVFDPAMQILRDRGLPFEVRVADKAARRVPRAAMPEFYRDLDVLVCNSLFEGTPNPVLEAMASGCGVVSTDVGIVRDVFGPLQMQFILHERSPEALADALARLIRDPETLAALKRENVARRESLGWETRWPAWVALFEEARANALADRDVGTALSAFRSRKRTPAERLRRLVATNKTAFRIYTVTLARWPGLIRYVKKTF